MKNIKVKTLIDISVNGKLVTAGKVIELEKNRADKAIKNGYVEKVEKKRTNKN